jgi:YjbE family integral membrane protein
METTDVEAGIVGSLPLLEILLIDFTVSEMWTVAFWGALWKIIVANIVLSGDNAVVIAMACRDLSEKYRRRAIFLGSAGAVLLRIVFCAVIGLLLGVPYLKLAGGALLLWIGVKLVAEEEGEADIKAHENLWAAIWTVVVADAVMSLDNAIAIAAAAKGNFALIALGLAVSIPIIVFGATLIARLLDRFPWLAIVGAALIGWIAGEVMAGDGRRDLVAADGRLVEFVAPGTIAAWLDARLPQADLVCAAAGTLLVVTLGFVAARVKARRRRKT